MNDISRIPLARWPRKLMLAMATLGSLFAAAGCAKKEAAAPPASAVPVVVATAAQKTIPVEITAIGNVEAYSTVSIKPQISGQLLKVHIKEGDFVHQGQLLFTIDPRPFQAALQQAQATLARDKAIAENDRINAARYMKLFEEGVAPREQADQYASAADAQDALVRADEAALETAKLNLQYCTIYSPIEGRTGSLMVKEGNLVKANDVPILVVINQLNPIYVNFAIPEQYLPDVKRYMARGSLKVGATIPNDSGPAEQGRLTFVDNNVDVSTGTIHLKATFANPRDRLWPGQFVNSVLTLTARSNAVVVPSQAVQSGQNGTYVFVVKADGTAESRLVVTGSAYKGDTVVEKGVQPGETVVTDGQIRLVPGARVQIKNTKRAGESTPASVPGSPGTS